MVRIVKTFWKIVSSRIIFSKPKKAKTVVWGVPKYAKEILKQKKFNLKKIEFIEIWGESYNFYILLRCFSKLKFSLLDYSNEYIAYVNPKIIISFLDNYRTFYKIKKNVSQKKIIIQNSWRCNEFRFFEKNVENSYGKVDYIFVQNVNIKKKYQEISGSKVITIGSFLSNTIQIKNTRKKIDVLYISTFRDIEKKDLVINKNIYLKDYINSEAKLVKNIHDICKLNKKILHILPSQKIGSQQKENKYYQKILGNKKTWKIIKRKNFNYKFPYKIVDTAKIVIGIDSTLLYEAFGRGIKTIFCDIRPKNEFLKKTRHFAWPKKYSKQGFFWLSKNDPKIINNVFLNVWKIKNKKWKSIINKYKQSLMFYDKNNSQLIKTINKRN